MVGVAFFLALWKLNALVPGIIAGLIVSVVVSPAGERYFGRKDPGQVVIDEIACFPLAMLGLPVTAGYLIAAFVLFRLFDVVKPPPARQIQRLPAGWGITADDVVATLYTCGVLHLWRLLM